MIQLDFFEETEISIMKDDITKVKNSCDRTRKALFARHGELYKNYMDLLQRMEIIEKHICKGVI